jgi:hypothetical protein
MSRLALLAVVVITSISACSGQPKSHDLTGDIEVSYGAQDLLTEEFNRVRDYDSLSIKDIEGKDVPAVLARLRQMPNLSTIKFHACDLSKVDENSPLPEKIKTVLLADGSISQGTLRWLAKFPNGNELIFAGLDTRRLTFDDLGKFTWITFNKCEIPQSAINLAGKVTLVTFNDITLVPDAPSTRPSTNKAEQ